MFLIALVLILNYLFTKDPIKIYFDKYPPELTNSIIERYTNQDSIEEEFSSLTGTDDLQQRLKYYKEFQYNLEDELINLKNMKNSTLFDTLDLSYYSQLNVSKES